jgi:2-oxoglutarate ferredoxin oxidoreductase subunit beta
VLKLSKLAPDYDPRDRQAAYAYLQAHQAQGEIPTGLLYIDDHAEDMHALNATVATPLSKLPFEELCPGSAALDKLQAAFR